METSQRQEILMVEHDRTLKRISMLLGQIKELLYLIAELLEQQQHLEQQHDIGEQPTCGDKYEKQRLILRGSDPSKLT